jgi:hypothetical protein
MNNLQIVINEGRLISGKYARAENGRQLLCALTALTGDPNTRPKTCPGSVAPAWVAHLLPWWDDAGARLGRERWLELMTRLAGFAHRLGELTDTPAGRRALARCQLVSLSVARETEPSWADAIDTVIALWTRVLGGDEPSSAELASASAWVWAETAAEAEEVAWAEAATWAEEAEAEAAIDRIITGHFDAIEKELAA